MTDNNNCMVSTVYKKAVIYFKADIAFSDSDDLIKKSDQLETEICLELDNLHSGNSDYQFSFDGISDISEDDIPDWIFD